MPSDPEMVGTETLAIVMSSTAMKFAVASTIAASHSIPPFRGCFISVRLGVDRHEHRQADLQRMRGEVRFIERDTYRHALHHLDPVTGRVLCRDRGEGRARAAGEAGYGAAIGDLAPVEVGGDLHRLTDAYVVELAFLEVRVHMDLRQRHDGEQRRALLHLLADLHRALRHHAIDRRAD